MEFPERLLGALPLRLGAQYQGPKDNQQDFRVIINYAFPLL
jgi:hypothetical protein